MRDISVMRFVKSWVSELEHGAEKVFGSEENRQNIPMCASDGP